MGKKLLSTKIDALYTLVLTDIGKGIVAKKSCKRHGLKYTTYLSRKYAARRSATKVKRKLTKKLIVHDLPQAPLTPGKAFLIYGAPHELAEFARSYT